MRLYTKLSRILATLSTVQTLGSGNLSIASHINFFVCSRQKNYLLRKGVNATLIFARCLEGFRDQVLLLNWTPEATASELYAI